MEGVKNMKRALVLGAGGFIGSHMVRRLKSEDYWVTGVDLKYPNVMAKIAITPGPRLSERVLVSVGQNIGFITWFYLQD